MAFDKLHVPLHVFRRQHRASGETCGEVHDVIVYPQHRGAGGPARAWPAGNPLPYRKSDLTPNIGTAPDQTDDTRRSFYLGRDGLRELVTS